MKNVSPEYRNNIPLLTLLLTAIVLVTFLPAGCESEEPPPEEPAVTMTLTSAAFQDGGSLPDMYTCDGQDTPPPLSWNEPPAGTQSFALIVEDLDSPAKFTHWIIFNIPPDSREIDASAPQGKNDFGDTGYGGPCPPSGKAHRYRFNLYALDTTLDLEAGASKKQVRDAMEGHILALGQLTGAYQR